VHDVALPPGEVASPAQAWQVAFVVRNWPAGQGVKQNVLASSATLPAGQGVQVAVSPPCDVVLPAHAWQVKPAPRNWPAAQGAKHTVRAAFAIWPAGHAAQAVALPPDDVVFAAQAWQLVGVARNWPAVQVKRHAVRLALATWLAAHAVHEVETPPMLTVLPVHGVHSPVDVLKEVPGAQPTQVLVFRSHVCAGSEHSAAEGGVGRAAWGEARGHALSARRGEGASPAAPQCLPARLLLPRLTAAEVAGLGGGSVRARHAGRGPRGVDAGHLVVSAGWGHGRGAGATGASGKGGKSGRCGGAAAAPLL
jgi:hypothetical protein